MRVNASVHTESMVGTARASPGFGDAFARRKMPFRKATI